MTGASGALQQVHVPLRKTRTFISNLKLANMTLFRTEFIHFGFYLWIVDFWIRTRTRKERSLSLMRATVTAS